MKKLGTFIIFFILLSSSVFGLSVNFAATGDITAVNTPGSYLSGGCLTGACSLYFSAANLVTEIGNWSADKGDYYTSLQIDAFNYVDGSVVDGYYDSINNFTGTLTSGKYCTYDGSEIDCDSEGGETNLSGYYNSPDNETDPIANARIDNLVNESDTNETPRVDALVLWNISTNTRIDNLNNDSTDGYFNSQDNITHPTYNNLSITDITSSIGNWSADSSNYYTSTQIDNFNYYNASDFIIGNYALVTDLYNATLIAEVTANTAKISYNDSAIVDALQIEAGLNTLKITDNESWNESYADSLYYDIDNSNSYYNSSDFIIGNYALTSYVDANNTAQEIQIDLNTAKISYNDSSIVNTAQSDIINLQGNQTVLFTNASNQQTQINLNTLKVTDNESWNESYADSLYVNVDGDTITGGLNITGSPVRLSVDTNLFFYDTADEAKHLNSFAENYDKLRTNTFTTALDIVTFTNITGTYVNISSTRGDNIGMILQSGQNAEAYRFDYNNVTLELTSGTDSIPLLNRIYVYNNAGVPTWEVSITEPIVTHAMVARINLGANGYVYWASLQEDGQEGFVKRVQRVNRKRGLLYENGLNYTATSTNLDIGKGEYINSIYDDSTTNTNILTDGIYTILLNGSFVKYTSLADLMTNGEYGDGGAFGSNKYVNVIFGITPFNGDSRIYAVVQNEPVTEYNSVVLAHADSDNKVNIYPSDEATKLMFLPVARMILNTNTGAAQIITGTSYAIDYRGGIAGGVSSGGGLTETDPVWTLDKVNYALTSYVDDNNTAQEIQIDLNTLKVTDNASWNEGLADTLYYDIGNSNGYYNSSDFVIGNYVPYTGATSSVDLGSKSIHGATFASTGTSANAAGLTSGIPNMVIYNLGGTTGRLFAYDGSSYYDMAIGDWNGGNPNIMLKVGGNVGIGDGTPSERLDVAGNIALTGLVDGVDIAEAGTNITLLQTNASNQQTQIDLNTLKISYNDSAVVNQNQLDIITLELANISTNTRINNLVNESDTNETVNVGILFTNASNQQTQIDLNTAKISYNDSSVVNALQVTVGNIISYNDSTVVNTAQTDIINLQNAGYITDGNTLWNNDYGFITDANASFIPDTNETTRMNEIYTWVTTNHSNWDTAYEWGDWSTNASNQQTQIDLNTAKISYNDSSVVNALQVTVGNIISYNDSTVVNTLQEDIIKHNSSIELRSPIASPTFTGTVTIPTPFTLGATSVTSTGTQLNYLNSATGTTGTTNTNLVFSTSPTLVTPTADSLTLTENAGAGATLETVMTFDNVLFQQNSTHFCIVGAGVICVEKST